MYRHSGAHVVPLEMKTTMKNRKPVTHLTLTTRQRRLAGLRAAQLGQSLSAYFDDLVERDARASGLLKALDGLEKLELKAAAE